MLNLKNTTAKEKIQLKSKKLAKVKMHFSPYWHLEILFIIPIMVVWTVLLVIIAMK